MKRKPKPRDEGIFAGGMGIRVVLQGMMFAALTLFGFWLGWSQTGDLSGGRTMAFIVLAMSQVVHSFNMRSDRSLFKIGPFGNKRLNGAVLISTVLVALVVFIPPVALAFGLIQLTPLLYLTALGLALVPVVVLEITKAVGLVKHKEE